MDLWSNIVQNTAVNFKIKINKITFKALITLKNNTDNINAKIL